MHRAVRGTQNTRHYPCEHGRQSKKLGAQHCTINPRRNGRRYLRTRANTTDTKLEPTGKHGVLHAPTTAHDDTTDHVRTAHDDTTAHDTTAHDTTTHDTTTPVRRHDDDKSTVHRRPQSTFQKEQWRTHMTLLLTGRGG